MEAVLADDLCHLASFSEEGDIEISRDYDNEPLHRVEWYGLNG